MSRAYVRECGGAFVDLFSTSAEAEQIAARLVEGGMPPERAAREAVRQAVSASLIGIIRAGNSGAGDQLLSMWLDEVYRWCRFNGGPHICAEDAAHDALLRMLKLLPGLKDPNRFRPWLWGVVWRVLKEHQRKSWFKSWFGDNQPQRVSAEMAPDQQLHAAERVARGQVLDRLTLEQRSLLYLAYVDGIGRAEIASQLDIPLGTLNRKLTGARAAFAAGAKALDLDGTAEITDLWGQG